MKSDIASYHFGIRHYDADTVPLLKHLHSRLSHFVPYVSPETDDGRRRFLCGLHKMQALVCACLNAPDMVRTQVHVAGKDGASPRQQARVLWLALFRFTTGFIRFLKRFYWGGDGKRLLKATEFFDKALKS